MQVVTWNIQWGKGRDGLVDLARIARTVAGADIIALQEVERHWRDMPDADEVARLSALMPDHHPAYCAAVDFHHPEQPALRRQYGLMVLSRWPVLSVRSFPLPRALVLGQVNDPSILMECVIGHPVRPFRLYVTHLNWISPRARLTQAKAILRHIAEAGQDGPLIHGPGAPDSDFGADWMLARADLPPMPAPAILTGDFNMTPASPEYTALCGPVTPWAGRLVEAGLFADALTLAGMEEGAGVTFPGDATNPDERIDHILVTPDLARRVRKGWIDAEADGSDHQPVWALLDMETQPASEETGKPGRSLPVATLVTESMMGLFRTKPVLQFLCDPKDEGVIAPPIPAKAYLPDWFRKLPAVDESKLAKNDTGLTVKRCMPFLDAMTTGWIIPLPARVRMEIKEGGSVMEAGWDFDRTLISNHGAHQVKGNPWGNRPPRKFHNYWTIVTPPGWSCLFINPMNRPNGLFEIISGVVDTDTYRSPVHFPFFATGPDGLHVIEKGSPIVQVIPFRRDVAEVETEIRAETKDEAAERVRVIRQTQAKTGWYRTDARAKR